MGRTAEKVRVFELIDGATAPFQNRRQRLLAIAAHIAPHTATKKGANKPNPLAKRLKFPDKESRPGKFQTRS